MKGLRKFFVCIKWDLFFLIFNGFIFNDLSDFCSVGMKLIFLDKFKGCWFNFRLWLLFKLILFVLIEWV